MFSPEYRVRQKYLKHMLDDLFLLSESRGKEASGLAVQIRNSIYILKRPIPSSVLIKREEYRELQKKIFTENKDTLTSTSPSPLILIGHTRLVTNGTQEQYYNNQPVIKNGIIGIHNGIIVNDEQLWKSHPMLEREFNVDTEILLALIYLQLKKNGSLIQAAKTVFGLIKGMASIGLLFDSCETLLLATNNGSLYICRSLDNKVIIFASEKHILIQLAAKKYAKDTIQKHEIIHVPPNFGYIIDLQNLVSTKFSLSPTKNPHPRSIPSERKKSIIHIRPRENEDLAELSIVNINSGAFNPFEKEYSRFEHEILSLRRCSRCVLPETVPFIEFDEKGICNYCRDYQKVVIHGGQILKNKIAPFIRADQEPDHIFMLSGGRDSCYGLHYVKTVLKLNPVAYTYDWGLITPLARRNISRMCGILGVEHILISADISKKRKNVQKNVIAWLKKPELGLVPLFMAGDKQFFYYANLLGRRFGTKLVIQCRNPLEATKFKSGFCGIKEDTGRIYDISLWKKAKLFSYYLKQFVLNLNLINESWLDSFTGFFSAYFLHHYYLFLYDYIEWDERKIISTLREKYDWEISSDSGTTWRIGDGTSAFYNYIYYTVAGFSEHDTFLSNQIREGLIDREKALCISKEQNKPRFEAIRWYCDVIGLDFAKTLRIIQAIPKLYEIHI
jgi:hypothetical protein